MDSIHFHIIFSQYPPPMDLRDKLVKQLVLSRQQIISHSDDEGMRFLIEGEETRGNWTFLSDVFDDVTAYPEEVELEQMYSFHDVKEIFVARFRVRDVDYTFFLGKYRIAFSVFHLHEGSLKTVSVLREGPGNWYTTVDNELREAAARNTRFTGGVQK